MTEREAFEKHIKTVSNPHRSPKAMFFTVNDGHGNIIYANPSIQEQWTTWQAAIEHVVTDGFVLVPKEPTGEMVEAANNCAINGKVTANIIYTAMIEAQEQSHDN